jgi:hypothetical protein
MLQRRVVLVSAMVAAVAALVAVLAIDRRAAADWDTDCAEPTQVYDESNMPTNLNLDGDDVVPFESGTFTGSVNAGGATICVTDPANFNPTTLNGSARLFVRGTAGLPALAIDAQALLEKEGTVRFLAQINVNGLATGINHAGATIIVDSDLSLGSGATITNDGSITSTGSSTSTAAQ